jgi:hypothetical protein
MAKKWQNLEKSVANALNSIRTPFSGSNSGVTSSDTLHPELYIECKNHANQAVLTLMEDTCKKAKIEDKIPILALSDPCDRLNNIYVVMNLKDIFLILKEIDLKELNKSLPEGTTVSKLLESNKFGGDILIKVKEDIDNRLSTLFRNKILNKESKNMLRTLAFLSFCLENIKSYAEGLDG